MGLSIWQILLVVVLLLLMFGRGKIPTLMSDIAAGIKGFKKEMGDDQINPTKDLENQDLQQKKQSNV